MLALLMCELRTLADEAAMGAAHPRSSGVAHGLSSLMRNLVRCQDEVASHHEVMGKRCSLGPGSS
ncbi:hypothetical protein ACLESO_04850 [Pyxidicoccus sp. 3LG]